MRLSCVESGATPRLDPIRHHVESLPRPLRFLGVGGLGLIADLAVFTLVMAHFPHVLLARLISLAAATVMTWRLNRALTFACSDRRPTAEALRYVTVAGAAQAASYGVFAGLAVSVFAASPQLAMVVGAGAGAIVSYSGQAQFAFRPQRRDAIPRNPA